MTNLPEPTLQYAWCAGASRRSPRGEGDSHKHQLAYWKWSNATAQNPAQHLILCVHGLTRTGRDFDALARYLLSQARHPIAIVCPDIAGRGKSDWLADANNYQVTFYVGDMVQLLQQLKEEAAQAGDPITRLDWVGTSMGGLIGMGYASLPEAPLRIQNLVLNDVGPGLEWRALERIGEYLGVMPEFGSLEEGAAFLRRIAAGFGPHTDAQWLALSVPQFRQLENGQFTLHYDAGIAEPQKGLTREAVAASEEVLWNIYDSITARTLLLRGKESDLLSPATTQAMQQRGPRAKVVEFEGVGHAPTLVAPEQQEAVWNFLKD